jgi:hypothetical protein
MLSFRRLVAVSTALVFASTGLAVAQNAPGHPPMEMHGAVPMAHPGMSAATRMPTMPGQEAFGTIQEIVQILEADPKTDWSKVDLAALREHLIDMNDLTLNARATPTEIPGGLKIPVTGTGLTVAAIQRMVPAHAPMINGHNSWHVTAKLLPNGALLTATASDPKEVVHIRGLGFIGLMATGAHHQMHHLAIAEGKHQMHVY